MNPEAAALLLADASSGTKASERDMAEALLVLAEDIAGSHRGIGMKGVHGAADWTTAELGLWDLSEDVRRLMVRDKVKRGRSVVLDAVAVLVRDPAYGKGRQNFILLLGERGNGESRRCWPICSTTTRVASHALDALATCQAPGFEQQAERLLREAKFPVQRQAAKKYLRRVAED